jgi:HEAT repeat protein
MNLFGQPNIEKMTAENDYDGLQRALEHRSKLIRLQAAHALARLNDGTGWRYLTDAASQSEDPETQEVAAAFLSELGASSKSYAHRAAPVLGEALKRARGDMAAALREALEAMGGPEAETALKQAGYEPSPNAENEEVTEFEVNFVRPVLPQTHGFELLSAEQHLNKAVELREAEMTERGLVECSLAMMLDPELAYAWYLRGVLFEDLERPFEAALAYEHAIELDSSLRDAREALEELREDEVFPPVELDLLLPDLTSRQWQKRRDAAAGIAEVCQIDPAEVQPHLDLLLELLSDTEREVRRAAIEALGLSEDPRAVDALVEQRESSWLLRFSIIEALATLGSVEALTTVLRREMSRIQERNPVFSSQRDPLVEVEYGSLMEVGVHAFEYTGDLDSLLELVEANAWVEVDDEDGGELDAPEDMESDEYYEELTGEDEEEYEYEPEQDEDLNSYVDEVAQMASIALERLALTEIARGSESDLTEDILQRLAQVPDLTLIDLSEEEDAEPQTSIVHDLSAVRAAAQAALGQ